MRDPLDPVRPARSVDLDDADDNLTSVGANLALDVGRGGISACPVVAVGYDFWSGTFGGVDLDFSVVRVRVGLGNRTFGRTDTTTDFYADAGLTAGIGRLFVRGGVLHVFEDAADTVFRVGLGVVF